MPVQKSHYETLLAEYSDPKAAIALLKQHRPYLEMIPSMRRPDDSIITIPLPVVRLQAGVSYSGHQGVTIAPGDAVCLPCDIAIIMCDPEWKVKIGSEIFIFIHRPQEELSDLLTRWRLTQIWLDKAYEWIMPHCYKHIYSQEAENIYPLFVLFSETPERIKQGLKNGHLPFLIRSLDGSSETSEPIDHSEEDLETFQEWQGWGIEE